MQNETTPRPTLSPRQLLLGAVGLEIAQLAIQGKLSPADALALCGSIQARIALSDEDAAVGTQEACRAA